MFIVGINLQNRSRLGQVTVSATGKMRLTCLSHNT